MAAVAEAGGVEHDENEIRKQFTVTERLAIAQRIAERLQGPNGTRQGQRTDLGTCGNISTSDEAGQKTRDIAAAKAGLGSGKTMEAAQKVVERDRKVGFVGAWVKTVTARCLRGLRLSGHPKCTICALAT